MLSKLLKIKLNFVADVPLEAKNSTKKVHQWWSTPVCFWKSKDTSGRPLGGIESSYVDLGKLVRRGEGEILLPAHLYETINIIAVMKRIR